MKKIFKPNQTPEAKWSQLVSIESGDQLIPLIFFEYERKGLLLKNGDWGAVIEYDEERDEYRLWCPCCLDRREIQEVIRVTIANGIKTLAWGGGMNDYNEDTAYALIAASIEWDDTWIDE